MQKRKWFLPNAGRDGRRVVLSTQRGSSREGRQTRARVKDRFEWAGRTSRNRSNDARQKPQGPPGHCTSDLIAAR